MGLNAHQKPHNIILTPDRHSSSEIALGGVTDITASVEGSDIIAYFHLYTQPDSPAARLEYITGRPIAPDPKSEESMQKIRSWIQECCESHPECEYADIVDSTDGVRKYPSRLLDVGLPPFDKSLSCVLVDGKDALGRYATLSYCWGKSQALRTLKCNLSEHKKGIHAHEMPKTLQDAVVATRNLGVRFLWIDALCIVQDDSSEWASEALHMGRIYQNSFCTIAAVGSNSSAGGLYIARPSYDDVVAFRYTPHGEDPTTTQSEFFIRPVRHTFLNRVQESTWNSRGWILQERILSRRIILFAFGQTFFECQRHSIGEDGRDLGFYEHKRFGNKTLPQGEDWGWCLLVQDYTQRILTEPRDKLFAVDGLASNMHLRTGKTYCAGAWCERLPLHTLWYVQNGDTKRPPFKRAPSWSWAAIDGPVLWSPRILGAKDSCEMSIPEQFHGLKPNSQGVPETWIEFLGQVISVNRSDFAISMGRGKSGLDKSEIYLADIDKHTGCYALVAETKLDRPHEKIGWAVFDESICSNGPFVAAYVSKNNMSNAKKRSSANVLIVKAFQGQPGYFERVGTGEIVGPWFNDVPREFIRIY
ncbi:HET-domain-containing protein [Glonium stellatum]|uniref:HET-domain-containing protein n=1 Tax=Glonium stellatum TaxID=574774 RepID=A0A8E2EWG0_9PEZI|nr:HET-domain-containing protein [Glonium stellatum]